MTTEVMNSSGALYAHARRSCSLLSRNRPSDGSAVAVHFPTKTGEVRAMYMGTKQLERGSRVLIVDDFMRGGSTAAGMLFVG